MLKNHKNFLETALDKFEVQHHELIHVTESIGRILASDTRAKYTSPHKDMSAANGYAVISTDTKTAPKTLNIIGESTSSSPFTEELATNQAVKIYAGSNVPIGADTVIPLHEADEKDGVLIINSPFLKGQNICYTGVDFLRNEAVLKAGAVITARDIGLAAAMKVAWLPVRRKPNIAIIAVGDELSLMGDIHEGEKVTSSSSLVISAIISACGAVPINLGVAADTEISIERLMKSNYGMDLIVTTGGTSVSADGFDKKALDKKAIETTVNLSGPTSVILGKKNGTPVLAMPGTPISAQICSSLFLRPIINKMTDAQENFYKKSFAILDRDLDINDKEMDYIFSRLIEGEDKRLKAMPASSYDRLLMSSLAESDCIITVDQENCKKSDAVQITRFVCSVTSG